MATPKCKEHEDCFANQNGRCVCLKKKGFGDRDCPFYKYKDEVDRKQIEADIKAYGRMYGSAN